MLQALVAWFQGTLRGAVINLERVAGLEPLSQVQARTTHRAMEALADKLASVRSAHLPALDKGRTARLPSPS